MLGLGCRVPKVCALPLTPRSVFVTLASSLLLFTLSLPGYETQPFDWDSYLEKTKSKAAPARLFNMVRRLQGWVGESVAAAARDSFNPSFKSYC